MTTQVENQVEGPAEGAVAGPGEVVNAEEGAEDLVPAVGKDAIYSALGALVKEMTGKRVGKTGGRRLFDLAVERIFVEAAKEGTLRFNAGYGSLHIKNYGAGTRRLPSGQVTTFGERQKLRYEEGVMVSGLVATKGDLEAVQLSRKTAAADPASDQVAGDTAEAEVELS